MKLTWPEGRALRVFFSGDSLTAGEFSTTEDTSFRRLVTSRLGQRSPVEEVGTYKSGYRLQDIASGFAIPRGRWPCRYRTGHQRPGREHGHRGVRPAVQGVPKPSGWRPS